MWPLPRRTKCILRHYIRPHLGAGCDKTFVAISPHFLRRDITECYWIEREQHDQFNTSSKHMVDSDYHLIKSIQNCYAHSQRLILPALS